MRVIITSIIFLLFCKTTSAQKNGIIRGTAFDSSAKQSIAAATVTLLEKKDSSLVSFTMTDDNGKFEFKNVINGEYRLLITHVNYLNSNTMIAVNDNAVDLGNVMISNKKNMLGKVVVKSEAPPVTLINDTVQYNAGSFKTAPNANVEQLLKKLPGVKVEKDGTVKAQGETVSRVLVDGKEFFGSDPKVATKNLPADAIDKVQVYDRQSDQAQLTGFDDGNYEKTINLKLKKDNKKGMFGKINAGAGTDGKYSGKFNLNSFKGPRQISALATANNTNTEGFSFNDILNFTGELKRMMRSGNGNINISNNIGSSLGVANNQAAGINTIRGGGINYNNIIGTKTDLQSNYFYNHYNPYTDGNIHRQYFLPDSSYNYDQHAVNNNVSDNQRFNMNALYQIDSFNSIRFTPSFGYQKTNNRSQSNYFTSGESNNLSNQGFSNSVLKNEGFSFTNDLIYRRKISRRGRTFSFSLNTSYNQSNGSGDLFSNNKFYNPGGSLIANDTINQVNKTNAMLRGYTARTIYTEPLFRRSLLEFSVSKSNTKSTSAKSTKDFNALSGKYDMQNAVLSNDYENKYGFTQEGIRMRTQKKKYRWSLGTVMQQSSLTGKLITGAKDSLLKKNFSNLLPDANFQYNFSKFKSLSFRYNTVSNQPDVSQLQPVPDNRDPLNIRLGNPDLKQEYAHSILLNMQLVNPYKNKTLFALFNLQTTKNRIVNSDVLTLNGVKYTTPVNTNGVLSMFGNISYSRPVKSLKASLEISSSTNYYRGKQFINGIANNIKAFSAGPQVSLQVSPTDKFNFSLAAAYNYNNTKYSLQPLLSTKYLSQEYSSSVDWEIPKGFFFSADFTYTINSGRAQGFNRNLPFWNASISKQMLKFNRGEIKIIANDLLNSNIGINRSSNQNYIEDSRVNTVKRFFMMSFTYSLSKTGFYSTQSDGGGRVMRM